MIMRKKIICFILTLTIVMLTACGNTDAELKYQFIQEYDYYKNHGLFDIVIDKETGVNYIIFRSDSKAGMTVRLNKDGTPYVSEVNND